jgi:hypothetical protein
VNTEVFPKEGQVRRSASFLRYPSRSKNTLCLWSTALNIATLFNLEAHPGNLIWPSFGITTVCTSETEPDVCVQSRMSLLPQLDFAA